MSIIKNKDLLCRSSINHKDILSVVTDPPKQNNNDVIIDIDINKNAAVLDIYSELYPNQPTINEIRNGNGIRWLLSGGTLISDHEKRIAIGLRDGNSTDPFIFTNIGAGRCDQKLLDHCEQEMASEFILCVKNNRNIWYQADFGQDTTLLINLNKPDVRNSIKSIVKSIYKSGGWLFNLLL